jgi:UDP-N-acetylmuramate: L-alanyl-gamma-D-glutamyl-meso-diaminopimelate ligase
VILTSIEFDHADIYKDLDHVKSAFVSLLKLIPADGTLLYLETDQNIKSILQFAPKGRSFSYGLTPASDYRAEILQLIEEGTKFNAYFKNQLLGEFQVLLFGEYNILNALSTLGLAHQLGWNLKLVSEALKSFKGVKRRQELIGTPNGIAVIEDFAHHPTAVRETLKGLKMRFSQRKIWAVFEPRSATSRRKIFQKEYVQAFASADEALIMKAFDQTKIAEEDRFSTEQLVQDMVSSGQRAEEMNTVDEIVQKLKAQARSGDVIVIMSNGGFDGIYQKLLSALS